MSYIDAATPVGLELPFKEHQLETIDFSEQYDRVIIADKMGLGKTRSSLTAGLKREGAKRVLISCRASSLGVWRDEIIKWYPEEADRVTLVHGNKDKRYKLWQAAKKSNPIMVCTHDVFKNDFEMFPHEWDLFKIDEAHKLRNHKTQLFQATAEIQAELTYMITGTPAKKGPPDLYGYLNLLYPDKYKSYWQFVNRFMVIEQGPFGKEFLGTQNMEQLRKELSTIMIRHNKPADMPDKIRQIMQVALTSEEQRIMDKIEGDMIVQLETGDYLISPTKMTSMLRMRQLMICPKLIDPSLGVGSGIDAIIEHIQDNEIDHAVIFCPFPSAFPFLQPYMEAKLKASAQILRGGITLKQQDEVVNWFKTCKKGYILCSIQYAESFSLVRAKTGYFLGFEWDPETNYQAEDRLHRTGITENVNYYYVMHDCVTALRCKQIVDEKFTNIRGIYEDPQELLKTLRNKQ